MTGDLDDERFQAARPSLGRARRWAVTLPLLAIVGCRPVEPPKPVAPAPVSSIVPEPSWVELSGTCAVQLSPDDALIVGGVAASALKPTEAVGQLEKQLSAMKSYVEQNHGELQLFERVRTVKSPSPSSDRGDTAFEVVQRLQAQFPAAAPVDAILEKLIGLGLDRFGDNVLTDGGSRREVVVRFRLKDFDSKIDKLEKRCRADAWKKHCSASPGSALCSTASAPDDLQVQSFEVQSKEALLRANGGAGIWQLNYTRASRAASPPDLLGNLPIHLRGTILLTHREERR